MACEMPSGGGIRRISSDLLILDAWGPDRLAAGQRRDLMEIVEDRYQAGSTVITSQLPVDAWAMP
jgi:DNA replication protein DnaC